MCQFVVQMWQTTASSDPLSDTCHSTHGIGSVAGMIMSALISPYTHPQCRARAWSIGTTIAVHIISELAGPNNAAWLQH
eukprot:m.701407 g.701407  ORF g.701407 m.701407 type:complete len:79 (+) comp22913_c1_seq9:3578-3814(+)